MPQLSEKQRHGFRVGVLHSIGYSRTTIGFEFVASGIVPGPVGAPNNGQQKSPARQQCELETLHELQSSVQTENAAAT
jgi:hypothetical protein